MRPTQAWPDNFARRTLYFIKIAKQSTTLFDTISMSHALYTKALRLVHIHVSTSPWTAPDRAHRGGSRPMAELAGKMLVSGEKDTGVLPATVSIDLGVKVAGKVLGADSPAAMASRRDGHGGTTAFWPRRHGKVIINDTGMTRCSPRCSDASWLKVKSIGACTTAATTMATARRPAREKIDSAGNTGGARQRERGQRVRKIKVEPRASGIGRRWDGGGEIRR